MSGERVRGQSLAAAWRPVRIWMRAHRFALRITGCFLSVALATAFVRAAPDTNRLFWVANGVWLAFLLMGRRRQQTALLCAGFAAQIAGSFLVDTRWTVCLLLAILNLCEVAIAAFLLRLRRLTLPCFTSWRYLLRFFVCAVLVAPFLPGLINAAAVHFRSHASIGAELVRWMVADGLGAIAVTPACVALFRSRLWQPLKLKANWVFLPLSAAACYVLCRQSQVPFELLIYPLLVLIVLRMGLGWASLATLAIGLNVDWSMLRGAGPFHAMIHSPLRPGVPLQLFIASAMFILYSISLVLESGRATERRLRQIAALHRLVTENSRDVIIIADFNGNRRYVSAAAAGWGGWLREDILNRRSLSMVHPEDRGFVAETILSLRAGCDCALIEFRVRMRSGLYAWAEASMRTIRDPVSGAPVAVLKNIRDITDRKQADKKLQDAYHAVEALAVTDSLTGLANRRRFDQTLIAEWRRGMRERSPLSLLLIDVDKFKSYNDTYGHLRGDSCLKQVAEAALDAICRPGDLVARFGGEEFAILLPGTISEGALHKAKQICAGLRTRRLPHADAPSGFVTVSVGCATLIPQLGHNAAELVECADQALYTAKKSGRDTICGYPLPQPPAADAALEGQLGKAITQRWV